MLEMFKSWLLGCSGVTGGMTVGTAVTSRAAPIRPASSTSSPVRTDAACHATLSAMVTMTAETSPTSWTTCVGLLPPLARPDSSGVTTAIASPW